ncbi:MAG: DUF86 domain-containing protein [Bacteroidia bacterium]|nr:DUF86 domain-containing protein [Bacteroidia bacterium]
MLNKDRIRIRHMLDATEKALGFSDTIRRQDLQSDEMRALAIIRLLEIIGEAASKVSEETRTAHPDIPWREMSGTRNRLIHAYEEVDLDIVWQILSTDLPPLRNALHHLLRGHDAQTPLFEGEGS